MLLSQSLSMACIVLCRVHRHWPVNDFQSTADKKSVIANTMPAAIFKESDIEHGFARDKTATVFRNLSMEGYGRLKPFHIISTLEQYGEVPFSKPRSRADQRYTTQAMSAISAVEVRERLETRWAEEAKCMPRDSNAVAIAAVRDVSTLFKVHGSKTVRDFRKPAPCLVLVSIFSLPWSKERSKTMDLACCKSFALWTPRPVPPEAL